MFRITSTIRTSASLVTTMFFAQLLTACSGASGFNPATLSDTRVATIQQPGMRVRPDAVSHPTYTVGDGPCLETYHWVSTPSGGYYVTTLSPPGCDPYTLGDAGLSADGSTQDLLQGESSGNQYVLAVENSKGKHLGTLTGLTGTPIGIASDAKGDVWATNFPSNVISEYNSGASTPSATYADGNLSSLRYITLDQNNNVYVSGQSAKSGELEVDELQGSSFTPITTITGAVGGGIAVAPKTSTLWVCDEGAGDSGTISAYSIPGFRRRMQAKYSGSDTGIAITPSGTQVGAINNVKSGSGFSVSIATYDAKTGKVLGSTPSFTSLTELVGIVAK